MEKLTPQEEKAMKMIWELEACCVRDILNLYEDPKPPYTTLASVVRNLEKKKYIKGRHIGNVYEYTPVVQQSEYKSNFIGSFVSGYFGNSYKDLVSFFAKEEKISKEDLDEIINMIEKGKDESNG